MGVSSITRSLVFGLALGAFGLSIWGCGKSDDLSSSTATTTEDTSTSGTAAAAVGGAVSGSSSEGTLATHRSRGLRFLHLLEKGVSVQDALASTYCPYIGGTASGCSLSSKTLTFTYSDCNFRGSAATWDGSSVLTFSTGSPTCSTFPSNYTGTIARTFGTNTTRESALGTTVTINSGAKTAADGNSYSGGATATLVSGVPTQLTIAGLNYVAVGSSGTELFDHTITTSPVGGSSTNLTLSGETVNGTVTVFHNLAKIQATSVFSSVTFTSDCCLPVSGTITTTFSDISGVTPTTTKYNGETETLTITGCGTATYTGPEGYSGSVRLGNCL